MSRRNKGRGRKSRGGGGGGRKSNGKRNINNSSKKSHFSPSNLKRFMGKFPHLEKGIVEKYCREYGMKEGVKMLTKYDFEKNFQKQYYSKFKRIRLQNRHDSESNKNNTKGEEVEGENEVSNSRKTLCTFKETKGDLFSCHESESLCHCVSQDLKMSAGIAVLFVKKFGEREELVAQRKLVGDVAVLKVKDRFIYYMISKRRYFMIPSYENLFKSLKVMRNLCEMNNVRELSMPKIACGLDRLNWNIVKEMIVEVFSDYEIKITCYIL